MQLKPGRQYVFACNESKMLNANIIEFHLKKIRENTSILFYFSCTYVLDDEILQLML